jgi:hypothetical protein
MRNRAAKRDANEQEIIRHFRDSGCLCIQLSTTDSLGIPDLLVGLPNGKIILVEVKMPKSTLRPSQKKFFQLFADYPIYIARNACDVKDIIEKESK